MPLNGRERNAYEWFKKQEQELRSLAQANDGQLPRHEWWRRAYYAYPYLMLETDDVILERFVDVFTNTMDITAEAKIGIAPMMANDARFARLFTELIEETNWRGILTKDSIGRATEQIHSYFNGGTPPGVRMFRDISNIHDQCLFKFSKREFVSEMYKHGIFRISPASYYAKGSHIRAIKDLETARNYKLKAISEAINGQETIEFKGQKIPIRCGVVPLQFMMDDYYLFSTCKEMSRRMPTDFEADAALVIKNRPAFVSLLRNALLNELPNWEFLEGEVFYFDPYNDIPRNSNQYFWKHIAYAYQKEYRCILHQRAQHRHDTLETFFVELGPLNEIAEMVTA